MTKKMELNLVSFYGFCMKFIGINYPVREGALLAMGSPAELRIKCHHMIAFFCLFIVLCFLFIYSCVFFPTLPRMMGLLNVIVDFSLTYPLFASACGFHRICCSLLGQTLSFQDQPKCKCHSLVFFF